MLEGDIEVRQDLGMCLDEGRQCGREGIGMDIEETDPKVAVQADECFEQRHEAALPTLPIGAVGGEVLGDEVELPDP